jgi:Flp pilus assembly protein TadB
VIVAVLAAIGTILGSGVVLVAGGLGLIPLSTGRQSPGASTATTGAGSDRSLLGALGRRRDFAIAGLAGLVALVITRWPMAVPLAVLAVLGSRGVAGNPTKSRIEQLEAIAAWTEMLRDTLAGAAGLTQALIATAPISPKALRPQVSALAARLNAGVSIVAALAQLADDIGDPAADTVVACLVMAASERAQRLSELLGALADTTREEVAMRLGVEASRASSRTAMRMITGFSFGLLGLMAVFARSYLSPYRTAAGQLVLVFVGCLYGLGLLLMARMVRPKPFPRLPIAATRAAS